MDFLAAASPATELILKINKAIVNPLIIVMFAFALVAFLWGVRGYITHADDHEARLIGANHMLWGVIGMALMVMSFTIVRIVAQTFGFDKDARTEQNYNAVLGGKK